ncbi:hypothetical protein N7453_004565 [Penicillium expansum]|nr:hypothetical protein N7453_004565 [Penicillium expansum]
MPSALKNLQLKPRYFVMPVKSCFNDHPGCLARQFVTCLCLAENTWQANQLYRTSMLAFKTTTKAVQA